MAKSDLLWRKWCFIGKFSLTKPYNKFEIDATIIQKQSSVLLLVLYLFCMTLPIAALKLSSNELVMMRLWKNAFLFRHLYPSLWQNFDEAIPKPISNLIKISWIIQNARQKRSIQDCLNGSLEHLGQKKVLIILLHLLIFYTRYPSISIHL